MSSEENEEIREQKTINTGQETKTDIATLQAKINELKEALKAEQEKVAELHKENKALIKENKKLAKKVATVQDEYAILSQKYENYVASVSKRPMPSHHKWEQTPRPIERHAQRNVKELVKTFDAGQEQQTVAPQPLKQQTSTQEEQKHEMKNKEKQQPAHSHKQSLQKCASEPIDIEIKKDAKEIKESTTEPNQTKETESTTEKKKSKGSRKSIFGNFFKKKHNNTVGEKGPRKKRKEKRSESIALSQGIVQELEKDNRTRSASSIDNPMVTTATLQAELTARQKRKAKEAEANISPEEKAKRAEEKKLFLLKQTIAELISSEETYINFLTKVKELIIVPLKSRQDILPEAIQRKIFSVFEVILSYNGTFLKELLKAKENNPDCPNVAKPFKLVGNFLKVYNLYVENYDTATQVTEEQMKSNQKFKKFIEGITTEHKAELGYPLSYYLIMPVQRIPRYVLFLKNLIEYTENINEMHEELKESFQLLSHVAEQINKRQRLKYQANRVTEIQSVLKGDFIDPVNPQSRDLINPRRYLVLEGKLLIDKKNVYAFLFNDMLMFTTVKEGGSSDPRYKLLESYDLLKTQVEVNDETPSDLSFTLTIIKGSGPATYDVVCDSLASRSDWVSMLSAEIKQRTNEHENQITREFMIDDSRTPKPNEHTNKPSDEETQDDADTQKGENIEKEESPVQEQKGSATSDGSKDEENREQAKEGETASEDQESIAKEDEEAKLTNDIEETTITTTTTHSQEEPDTKVTHKHRKHKRESKLSEVATEEESSTHSHDSQSTLEQPEENEKEKITSESEEGKSEEANE